MALDRFIASVRSEVAKRFDLKSGAEIDAFFIGMEESAKDNQEALEKRDKMLRDTVAELCEAKRLLKAAIKVINENCDGFCEYCKYYTKFNLSSCELGIDVCENNNQWEWKYEAEALKLFGEDGDTGGITIQETKV